MADEEEEEEEEYGYHQPRLLRGHPRWAPTNNPSDINCFHFLIPIPKRSYAKKQYDWMTQRNDLNSVEDKKRRKAELIYYGSLMDCLRLKYFAKSKAETAKQLIARYGADEPFNTQMYRSNHHFKEHQFRQRPPSYFDDASIPNWRYKQLQNENNHSLNPMEFEWLHKQKKKWKKYYKYCWIRGKIKKFILNQIEKKQQLN